MSIRKVSEHYEDVQVGKEVAVFNYAGLLEIAMNNHSAPGDRGGADALLDSSAIKWCVQFESGTLL